MLLGDFTIIKKNKIMQRYERSLRYAVQLSGLLFLCSFTRHFVTVILVLCCTEMSGVWFSQCNK